MENKPLFSKKDLIQIAWPLLVEQLLAVLVGVIDVLMVSVLGENAVSGVSIVDTINGLIIQVLFSISAGGNVVCAMQIGAGEKKKADRTAAQIILINIFSTILITTLCLSGGSPFLNLLFGTVEEGVMSNAALYMRLTALSFPFLGLYQAGAAVFRANGNTKISMRVALIMNGINVVGNAVCIFGLHMGVEGVAIPTIIARGFAAIYILLLLQHSEVHARSLGDFIPQVTLLKKILSIGIPNGLESGMFQFGKLFLQSLIAELGTASIAAYAVSYNLATFYYLPGSALGAALLTIVGQCKGAGEMQQAKKYTRQLLLANYLILIVICVVLVFGRSYWVGSYHLSAEASSLARDMIRNHGIAMIIWPIAFLLPYYFRAIGRAGFTMVVAVGTMWIFRIGLAYLFIRYLHMNLLAVWYAMFIDWVVRIAVFIPAFRKT